MPDHQTSPAVRVPSISEHRYVDDPGRLKFASLSISQKEIRTGIELELRSVVRQTRSLLATLPPAFIHEPLAVKVGHLFAGHFHAPRLRQ